MSAPRPPLAPSSRQQRRGHGRVTLAEVATHAGVTAITVSRFLREPRKVAPHTALRIRDALSATGYVPNKQAGQLASGRSNMVAALIPNIANSIFAETVQGLAEGLQAAGHELMLASSNYSMEREEEQLRALLGWFPSALVVTGRHHTRGTRELLRRARAAGTPVIEVWDHHPDPGLPLPQIGFDHERAGARMAEHLLDQGWTRLAYVDSAVAEDFRAHERGAGFAAAAKARQASVLTLTAPPGDAFDAGRRALGALLERPLARRPQAVAFANDHLTCGALLAAQDAGLVVPLDIALLGFGDFAIGRQLRPALSSVRAPRHEIGAAAAQAIVRCLHEGIEAQSRELLPELVVRDSSRRPG